MRKRSWFLLITVLLAWSYFARPVYDFAWIGAGRVFDMAANRSGAPTLAVARQGVVDRNLRQGDEIAVYLQGLRDAVPEASASPALDFSGPEAYVRSADTMRARLRESLRYPPPGFERGANVEAPVESMLGEDEFATYRELKIPVMPGVFATGLYLRPRAAKADEKLPLVIAAHGRGGMPPPTEDGKLQIVMKTHRDLAWDALKRGYAVWLPTYVHYGREGDGLRDQLTVRAWQAGTSLPAIEIAKTVGALDVLLRRTDIDPQRVAMMGQSYGGFYTLYTTALDPRIRVAVVAAYFNDRAMVLDPTEPFGFLDWRFPDSLTLWRDPSVAALVAPRPLLIEFGNQDQLFPVAGARKAAPEVARVYARLGIADRFEYKEFVGRHDFDGAAAMEFIDRHMK